MRIIVCVKQVPATNEVKINKETNTIIREGIDSIINPFDTYAIEEGLKIKDKHSGSVTVLSMGLPATADLLKETFGLGVDEAVLLSDRAFAGADSLATSYALSMGIKKLGKFDLIICGKQATDGDTAQVGPGLAEKLGIPHTTYVKKILKIREGYIRCQRLLEEGYEIIEMPLPALITVVKDINEPRLSSIKNMVNSRYTKIPIWNADDIGADKNLCGLKGSPTQVIKTFVPTHDIRTEMFEGNVQEQSKKLVDRLMNMEFKVCK